jgi:AraC family transcriptional regulator, glycine betaine-responsive activator
MPSEIDGNRYSTAGGVASIDLVLSLIEERCGAKLTNDVSEQLIYSSIRQLQSGTPISPDFRKRLRHPKLKTVVWTMDDNLEEPLKVCELARMVNISVRQLERLFVRYIGDSLNRYYLTLRLNKVRRLLCQTSLSIIHIELSCGFTSSSHFSKCYRAKFGVSPYETRRDDPVSRI